MQWTRTSQNPIMQERIRFGDDHRLAGVITYPAEREPRCAILICSPHPNFAGDMNNNVTAALADGLAHDAITLRFDYRGIGESRIALPPDLGLFDYWDQVEQSRDYRDALADTAAAADFLQRASAPLPMFAVGYSFGAVTATMTAIDDAHFAAMVGIAPPLKRVGMEHLARGGGCPKPCLLTSGTDDFVHDPEVEKRLMAGSGPHVRFERITGADHFFRAREAELVQRIHRFIEQQNT